MPKKKRYSSSDPHSYWYQTGICLRNFDRVNFFYLREFTLRKVSDCYVVCNVTFSLGLFAISRTVSLHNT